MVGRRGAARQTQEEFLLAAPGLARPILVSDAEEVAGNLAAITRGWAWERRRAGPDAAEIAAIRVGRSGEGYVVDSHWLDAPMLGLSAVGAACSIACDLGLAHLDGAADRLGLHAGAVEIGGRLVVLAGPRRAGKSTLVTRLGAEGLRVYADDILPLGPDGTCGVALGVAPRLRLPLPRGASPAFSAHVAANVVALDDQYGYVMPPDLAPRGAASPIGVILLLDRRPRLRARLEAATRADALRLLILRNLVPDRDPAPLLARLEALVAGAEVFWLRHSDLEQAAALVRDTFAPGAPRPRLGPARRSRPAVPVRSLQSAQHSGSRFRCRPGITARAIEGEAFLCDPDERAILHLNPLGAAVWSLLGEGVSAAEAAAALSDAYPDVAPARIGRDVAALFADLQAAGLIIVA